MYRLPAQNFTSLFYIAAFNAFMEVYCGIIKYYSIPFGVYWNQGDKTVRIVMPNNSNFPPIHDRKDLAESKEEALKVAMGALKREFAK